MRIGVVGTGGIGGPYGASLAKAGVDVTFVARGAHLAAMRENGLRMVRVSILWSSCIYSVQSVLEPVTSHR